MADRYQDRPFAADDGYDRGDDPHASGRIESDPLAELARLIGQTDPFANIGGRANAQVQPRSAVRAPYEPPSEHADDGAPAGPPPWMQRAVRQETPQATSSRQETLTRQQALIPQQDYPSTDHPIRRYAAQHAAPEPEYEAEQPYAHAEEPLDPSRYDDALYGQLESEAQHAQQYPAYSNEPYGYQDDYDDAADTAPKRRGGLTTVFVVLALAVVGTGAAYAYRTYVGAPRSGEPPVIKADNSPTKIVPAPADGNAKLPDRLAAGDGKEKIVPREEAPVDVSANTPAGPRTVFPPLNQNPNPPSAASVAPNGPLLANAGNGTMPNNEPHRIKTFSVRGDQPDSSGTSAATTPAAAARPTGARAIQRPASAANANASSANAPMSLSPQTAPAAESRTRMANNAPAATASTGGGGYVVQVSSQKNEADAQASYRVLQGKFPSVLGSRAALIKRADLGGKGVYYRAMVGPFGSSEEAAQLCGNLKSAGGQCVVQRN